MTVCLFIRAEVTLTLHWRPGALTFGLLLSFLLESLATRLIHAYELKPLPYFASRGGGLPRIFMPEELTGFDGRDVTLPIYLAVRGVVFDVTEGKDFYGKESPYNVLTGKDASRAISKMSLEPDDMTADLQGLSDEELEALDSRFFNVYKKKYPVVGYTLKAVGENLNLFSGSPAKDEL